MKSCGQAIESTVVGTDGVSVEGSYGSASGPVERPEDRGDPVCTFTQELSLRCD